MLEQRQLVRRKFSYYMLVIDDTTGELVGHWTDISPGGFRLESLKPIPKDKDFRFRIDLTSEIANKSYMVFSARSRWCQKDAFDPNLYIVGFQVAKLPPDDFRIFKSMFEKYGSEEKNANSSTDYLWR
jgi:hypothetical protein